MTAIKKSEKLTKHVNRDGNISQKENPKTGNRQSKTDTKTRYRKHALIVETNIRNKSVQRLVVSATDAKNSIIMQRCVAQVENYTVQTKASKPEETGNDYLFLDTITAAVDETKTSSQNQAEHVILYVNNTKVKLKLDTGAEVNVIQTNIYKTLASTTRIPLRKPNVNLVAYNGRLVPVEAVCNLQCKY